jgi:YHS domain-containing protein
MLNTRCFALVCTIVVAAALFGCADLNEARAPSTRPTAAMTSAKKPHAECLVCKYNADLACIDVDVDEKTASYVYNGKTYYFCSEECRDQFAKNPAKYAALAEK